MEVIIVLKKGIATIDSPYLFKSEAKAAAKYEDICRGLLGDDFEDIYRSGDDSTFDRVNTYLAGMGCEIMYYTGVPII
jgi:hypothetical protein